MQLDPEDIKSYEQRNFFENDNKIEMSPITIFFSVLAAILVAWVIREAYIEWQVRQALAIFNQQMAVINEQSQQSMDRMQNQTLAIQQQANERLRIEGENNRLLKLQEHQFELDKQAAIASELENKSKKEQAWVEFYKPIKGCESSNNDRDLIKCGNDYAKAKKIFEAKWGNGNL